MQIAEEARKEYERRNKIEREAQEQKEKLKPELNVK